MVRAKDILFTPAGVGADVDSHEGYFESERGHIIVERRKFTAALSAAAGAPVLFGATPSYARDAGHHPGVDGARLERDMATALAAELGDRATARRVAPWSYDIGFDWSPPTARVETFDFLVGYAFGNRAPAGGGDPTKVLYEPGPVNEQLADTIARIRARRTVPVFAQWEIARFLESKYRMSQVVSIEPEIAADGTITYLSTDGVAAQIEQARKGNPGGPGRAGVVGFRDHVKRCVLTTRGRNMEAFAPEGFEMPGTYDPESGQIWTRRRDLYLVHDMTAQWTMLKARLGAELYPNG
ncbi:hypothetical protein ACFXKG_20905 [Streptomyces sp. NPDC059255]|uniref:hypothetical protein n=1 Tax=Streptomyces sp. NPDC059255 TaxID=3346793 RepID=UPI0036B722F3